MPIYTRTGDKGETSVFGGKRLSKAHLQVEAIGKIDEATSFIGLAIAAIQDTQLKAKLTQAQKDLYTIMAFVADAQVEVLSLIKKVWELEKEIDAISLKLPELKRFLLPQGGEQAARVHVARTLVRTAERAVVRYYHEFAVEDEQVAVILSYLNRLSDYLFTVARKVSEEEVVT